MGEIVDGYDPGSRFSSNPIGYVGEFYDKESGMIYLRGRYYDPETRRFITEDPAKDGWNWYTYCGNNPVMFIDPMGTHQQIIRDNGVVTDIRYDLRQLLDVVHGAAYVEDNIVHIKALGKTAEIDLVKLAEQEKHLEEDSRHNIDDNLHYTMKEFLTLLGVDFTVESVQIQVSEKDVRYSRFKQWSANTVAELIDMSVGGIISAIDGYGGAVESIRNVLGLNLGWGQGGQRILNVGTYKKQFFTIQTSNGPVIISNYISSVHQDDKYGKIVVEHMAPNTGTMPTGKYKDVFWEGD